MNTKYCSGCHKCLPVCNEAPLPNGEHDPNCAFFLRRNSRDGHGYYCRPCAKAAEQISRNKRARKEAKQRYMREYMRRRREVAS